MLEILFSVFQGMHQKFNFHFSATKHAKESKVEYLWAKCGLLERQGDTKRMFDGYQQILNVLPKDNSQKYVILARDITKVSDSTERW